MTLRATAVWEGKYKTRLGDGRGHEVLVDLPQDEGGDDLATSALELNLLSMAGCISTIFALVARKRRLHYQEFRVELDGDRPERTPTILSVKGTCVVVTDADPAEVDTAVRLTVRTCPVGVLYDNAHVPVDLKVVVRPTKKENPSSPAQETAAGLSGAPH